MHRIISSKDDVPNGYIPLGKYDKASRERGILTEAAQTGEIPAVKIMRTTSEIRGPVYVEEAAAIALLRGYETPNPKRNEENDVLRELRSLRESIENLERFLRDTWS